MAENKGKSGAGKFFLGALLGVAAGAVAGRFISAKAKEKSCGCDEECECEDGGKCTCGDDCKCEKKATEKAAEKKPAEKKVSAKKSEE